MVDTYFKRLDHNVKLVDLGNDRYSQAVSLESSSLIAVDTLGTISNTVSVVGSVSLVYPIENGNVKVAMQDQYSSLVGGVAVKLLATNTLYTSTIIDSKDIELVGGHSIVTNSEMYIIGQSRVFYATAISVTSNIVTVDTPLDFDFEAGTNVFDVQSNMNVSGSTIPQIFQIAVGTVSTYSLDITGLRMQILDNAAMDDGKFGGISALTNGVVMRKHSVNDVYDNLVNLKSNGDIALKFNNSYYTDKAPAGDFGFNATWKITIDMTNTIRIDPGESLDIIVQDDLTDLSLFKTWVYGHYVV